MANSMAVIPDNEIIVEGGGLVPSTQGASSGDVLTVGQNGPEWAAPGGGSSYSAGDGINISSDVISTKLADGSGLRFDQGGLQIVHQLATPGAEDEGKVLTVTNSLGAYAWATPSGGGSSVTTIVAPTPASYTKNYDRVTFDFGSRNPPITLNAGRNLWQITATMDGCSQFAGDTGFVFVSFTADLDDGVSTQTINDQFTANATYNPTIGSSGTSAYIDIVMPIFVPTNMTNVVVTGVSFMFNNVSKVPQTPGGGSYIGIWSI